MTKLSFTLRNAKLRSQHMNRTEVEFCAPFTALGLFTLELVRRERIPLLSGTTGK